MISNQTVYTKEGKITWSINSESLWCNLSKLMENTGVYYQQIYSLRYREGEGYSVSVGGSSPPGGDLFPPTSQVLLVCMAVACRQEPCSAL